MTTTKRKKKRKLYFRTCVQCATEFHPYNNYNKFCSLKCAYLNKERNEVGGLKRRKAYETKVCANCKNLFTPTSARPNKQFCNVDCANTANGKRISQVRHEYNTDPNLKEELICETCNKKFVSYKRLRAKTCSNVCRFKNPNTPLRMSKAKHFKGTTMYSRAKRGWRVVASGEKIFFRSRMEANYAAYLDYLHVEWQYEPHTFWFNGIKRGVLSYTPDFFLPKENKYIETKGWMDSKSITKLKRMKKYHPKVIVEVVNWKDYKEIESKVARLIPNWEK